MEIIAVYVDDLILITESLQEMQHLKQSLSDTLKMKDLGKIQYCLGVNINIEEGHVSLSQDQYILKIIERYGLADANTPMDHKVKLIKDDCYSKAVDPVQYQSMVGMLLVLLVQI